MQKIVCNGLAGDFFVDGDISGGVGHFNRIGNLIMHHVLQELQSCISSFG